MDATIMRSTTSLVSRLRDDFSDYHFVSGDSFHWSPAQKTISYNPGGDPALLLHELAHAALQHNRYKHDVQLLTIERDAWSYAQESLAPIYHITIDEQTVQDALDTYRDWLHARSKCPICSSTGIQSTDRQYKCVACGHAWRANEALFCALRRYRSPK